MGQNLRDNIGMRFGEGLGEEGLLRLSRRPRYTGLRMRVRNRTYISAYAHATLAKGQLLDSYAVTTKEDAIEARARHHQIQADLELARFEFVVVGYHGDTGLLLKAESLK